MIAVTQPVAAINSTANQASYAFAPFTPAANATLVVLVFASDVRDDGLISGGSLAWTRARVQGYDTFFDGQHAYLFWATTGAAPGAATITFTAGGSDIGDGSAMGCLAVCLQATGVHAVSPVRQSASDYAATANPALTFPLPLLPASLVIAGFGTDRNPPGSTPPVGWTEILDAGYATPTNGATVAYRIGGESGSSIAFTAAAGEHAVVGIELTEQPGVDAACLDETAHNYTLGTFDLALTEIENGVAGFTEAMGNIVTGTLEDDTEDFDAFDAEGDEDSPLSVQVRSGMRLPFTADEITCENLKRFFNITPEIVEGVARFGFDVVTRRKTYRVILEHTMSCGTIVTIRFHRASLVSRASWLFSPDTVHGFPFELRAFPTDDEVNPFGYLDISPAGLCGELSEEETIMLIGYLLSGLPAPGVVGRLVRVTDDVGGIFMDSGERWFPISGGFINTEEMPGADLGTRFNVAFDRLRATGGTIVIPPGDYTTATELVLSAGDDTPVEVRGYGATIRTTGAISGLRVTQGTTMGGRTIRGLKIDHSSNAAALYGFNIQEGWNARLHDCTVVANDGVAATYAAVRVGNSNPAIGNTGSFWTTIDNLWVRLQTGSGKIPVGVLLEGDANATNIIGCGFNDVTTGVLIRNQAGNNSLPNGVVVDKCKFEGYTTGVHVTSTVASVNIGGHRFTKNRFEVGTTAFKYSGITAQPSTNPYMSGNYVLFSGGTYLDNVNGLRINQWDLAETPSIMPKIYRGLEITPGTSTENVLTLNPGAGTERGLKITPSNVEMITFTEDGFERLWLYASANSEQRLAITGMRGISRTNTKAKNLRGRVTFASAATADVAFGGANVEPDADYFVTVTGNVNETFWVPPGATKTATGFRIHSSNATSTAIVEWHLIR